MLAVLIFFLRMATLVSGSAKHQEIESSHAHPWCHPRGLATGVPDRHAAPAGRYLMTTQAILLLGVYIAILWACTQPLGRDEVHWAVC